jgi:polyhydroxybutyrate depolymerase
MRVLGGWGGLSLIVLGAAACADDVDPGASGGGGGAAATSSSSGEPSSTGTPSSSGTQSGTTSGVGGDATGAGGEGAGGEASGGAGGGTPVCGDGGPVGPIDVDHTLAFGGDDRTFRVHFPPGYPDGGTYPVVLMLHGYLEDGDQFETISQMTPAADDAGYIVVYGDGRSMSWNAGSCCGSSSSAGVDDVGFVGALLDEVAATYCVDERRIYAAGFSNGGMLSHRLACEMSDRIAAIGPTAGTLAFDPCAPSRPVPVMHTHGTDDFVVPWDGGGFGNATSVDDTIDAWLERNGCFTDEPVTVYESGDATCIAYAGCTDDAEVRLCTIEGGGHQWPGGESAGPGGNLSTDLETSEELLRFFDAHMLPEIEPGECDVPGDTDCDGLDQAIEDGIAQDYFPYYSLHPDEECSRAGIVYRVGPHPIDANKVFIRYVVLYETDCGLGGHVGDDEVVGVVVDPSIPAPGGIVSIKAIGHQSTACEQITDCGTCPDSNACDTLPIDGVPWPAVFSSKDKHATYAHNDCNFICDFNGCSENDVPFVPPMINAGEPGYPLVTNLTTEGFINEANGWTEAELFDFDPWAPGAFGKAGDVSDDLVDSAFLPDCY